jgi:hypothetical protein
MTACLASSCVQGELHPSVWPPKNFRLVVEELRPDAASVHVVRKLQIEADGTVVYATSSNPLVDGSTGTSLPVFDRICVYVLEPGCVRALARRLDRLGIGELVVPASAIGEGDGLGLTISWRAFAEMRVLPSAGRLRGSIAEMMSIIASYLPPGETFETPMARPIVPLLSGAPSPVVNAVGALGAYRDLLAASPDDEDSLLAAYGLACSLGRRAEAEQFLGAWRKLIASQQGGAGFDDQASITVKQRAQLLAGFLPPA